MNTFIHILTSWFSISIIASVTFLFFMIARGELIAHRNKKADKNFFNIVEDLRNDFN